MFISTFTKRDKPGTTGGLFIGVGLLMVLFAVLIIVMPQLLALLLASFIMVIGLGFISFGVQLKRITRRGAATTITRQYYED